MIGLVSPQHESVNQDDILYDEIGEDSLKTNGFIYNIIYKAGEKFAGTYIGQYATGKIDKLLKLIEDTAKWSLPQTYNKSESREPLERPLPWIPFIAMILVLRFVRLSLSIARLLIGCAPILPSDVVYFIQTRRRKLRALRITGMRDIRKKEETKEQKRTGLVSKLMSILSVVVCSPGKQAINLLENQITQEGANNNQIYETVSTEKPLCYKRKAADESFSDHDLTLDQIIDKYGNASSDDDSDFKPPEKISNKDSSSSESTSSATSDYNDEDEEMKETSNTSTSLEPCQISDNKSSHITLKVSETESSENIIENGQRVDKQPFKPIPMPKPKKQSPVPIPIQEIKQEPSDSDEEEKDLKEQCCEESKSSPKQINQDLMSAVVQSDKPLNTNDAILDQCTNHNQIRNENRDQHSQVDHKSEVFLTPATSNEDLFFSPVGSPILNSNFGFQPTSILKNSNAVYLERRGPQQALEEQKIEKHELGNENHTTLKVNSASQQNHNIGNNYSGKPHKNKFRGKRR